MTQKLANTHESSCQIACAIITSIKPIARGGSRGFGRTTVVA